LSLGKKATLDDFREAGVGPIKDDTSDLRHAEEFPDQATEAPKRAAA
jgi:hypothetical protein